MNTDELTQIVKTIREATPGEGTWTSSNPDFSEALVRACVRRGLKFAFIPDPNYPQCFMIYIMEDPKAMSGLSNEADCLNKDGKVLNEIKHELSRLNEKLQYPLIAVDTESQPLEKYERDIKSVARVISRNKS